MLYQDRVNIFAKNLNDMIERSGKQQKDIAVELDIPTSTLNNWSTGKVIPRVRMLNRLAEYFKCSIDDLISCQTEVTAKDKLIREIGYMDEAALDRLYAYAKFLNQANEFLKGE